MKKLIFIFSILIITGCAKEKGCTEQWADNYDTMAEVDDYSCYKVGCTDTYADNYEDNVTDDCCCTYIVRYTISCLDCSITYENASGGTSQESNVNSSWAYSFKARSGKFVYISAQNQNNTGSVTVTIKIGGVTYKTSTSSGAYVIATASGSI